MTFKHSIEVVELSKSYADVKALHPLSFTIPQGELFGFVGPDGGGKTTLFRLLTTLLIPDTGFALVEGLDTVKDYKKIRTVLGYMPGRFSLYQDLSVEENLNFYASVFGTTINENYHLIKDIYSQIEPFKKRLAGKLSGGMKQKLALSCALIHKPHVLILDEPTTGVDAVSRKEFWEMLKNLKQQGITIVVSTPYMDEASLCDRIALINKGEILSIDTPAHIASMFGEPMWAVRTHSMYQLMNDLKLIDWVTSAYLFGQYMHVTLSEGSTVQDLQAFLHSNAHQQIEINSIAPDIEDCFMKLMKAEQQ